MMYERFVTMVEERLKKVLNPKGVRCERISTVKNNGHRRTGIVFHEENTNVSPTIYMEEYFEKYLANNEEEEVFEEILVKICSLYEQIRVPKVGNYFDLEWLFDFSKVKEKLVVRLINAEKNKSRLNEIPYIPFLDLAIIFYVIVEMDEDGEQLATMLVRNEHLLTWEIEKDKLYEIALENSVRLLPCDISSMSSIIQEIMPSWENEVDDDFMYVLSNDTRNFGACTILYPMLLKSIGLFFNDNFYLLPSSVHEWILLPESKVTNKEELKFIVGEVNFTEVSEEEILSDNVYYYNRETEEVTM